MDEAMTRSEVEVTRFHGAQTEQATEGEVFDGLGFVEEANRDITKAVAELAERLRPILREHEPRELPDQNDEPVRNWSPLRERLAELNRGQHEVLAHIADIGQRLGI